MQPNILFIMTDQFRWDAIGSIGGWADTPNLDRLISEGVTFTNCVTNAPLCLPARLSLATGKYPHQIGVTSNIRGHDMPADTPTWMQAVRKAGYRTSLFGKTHLHRYDGDLRDREHLLHAYGFDDVIELAGPRAAMEVKGYLTDEWERHGMWEPYIRDFEERFANKPYVARPSVLPYELYPDVYVAQQAKSYLQTYADPRPWFCMLSFVGPHEPWDTPEPYASMYDPERMPKPIPRPAMNREHPLGYLDSAMNNPDYSPTMTEREVAELRANYAGNVTLIDHQIGEVLKTLEERGELERTMIVFTSDHGELNGDYGLIYKSVFLKSSVQIPLIIRMPFAFSESPVPTESRYDGVVELMDLGPTIAEIAGGRLDYPQYGRSLVPVLLEPLHCHRKDALSEIYGEYMLLTEDWKIVLNKNHEVYMLFDIKRDPCELNNLAVDPAYEEIRFQLISAIKERIG